MWRIYTYTLPQSIKVVVECIYKLNIYSEGVLYVEYAQLILVFISKSELKKTDKQTFEW